VILPVLPEDPVRLRNPGKDAVKYYMESRIRE